MWSGNLNSLGYSVLVVVVVVVLAVEFRLFIMPKTMLGGAVERGGVHNMPEMSVCCHVVAIVQTVLLAVVVVVVVLVVVLTFILTPTATAYANNYATNNDDGQQ